MLPLRTEQEPSTTTSITLDADYHSPLKRSALKRYVYLKEVLHADVQTSIPFSGASSRFLSPTLPVMRCERCECEEEERSVCEEKECKEKKMVECEEEERREKVECEEKEREEKMEECEEKEKDECEEKMEEREEKKERKEKTNECEEKEERKENKTEETLTTQNPPPQVQFNPEKTKPPSPPQEIEEVYEESSEEEEPQPQPFSLLSFLYRSFTRLFSSPVS